MNYKNGKWAEQILTLQHSDGTWGTMFHSLSEPSAKYPRTTEQALFRLKILGFDINDPPIRKTVDYMKACLRGERKMDDCWEKTHDWELFTQLMLSTWVKIFDPHDEVSQTFARRWAEVIERAFAGGGYNHDEYVKAYISQFNKKPHGGREIDFVSFYHISLLQGMLSPKTENLLLDYVISKPNGIYYVYEKQLDKPPKVFASKEASRYLGALELLSGYDLARNKLTFAADWLNQNKDENGQWDFGVKSKDGVYFPLSDSWRKDEYRKADCTERVNAFFRKLNG